MRDENIGLKKLEKIEINKSTTPSTSESINSYYRGNRIAEEQHHALHALMFFT